MRDLLATGYPSLDYIMHVSHSPRIGETALIRSMPDQPTYGGCGANVAVAMAMQGFSTGLAMVLGADSQAQDYLNYLRERDICTDDVICLAGERTSMSYLFVNPDDEYQNFFLPAAADAWQGQLSLTNVTNYRLALLTVGALHYNRQFVQQVQAAGVPLVWMLKPDLFAYPQHIIATFLEACSYLVMNHFELEYVLQVMAYRDVRALLHERMQAVVVTAGARGADVYTPSHTSHVPAVPPDRVVDTTGAGDAFTAGFLGGILRGETPEVAVRWGATLASFVIEALGCQTNLPLPQALQTRFERNFGL
jgi:nucleoside kinase